MLQHKRKIKNSLLLENNNITFSKVAPLFENLGRNKLLKTEEVAEMLAVSPRTIRSWKYRGVIPFIKVGRAVRFNASAIARWLERKC